MPVYQPAEAVADPFSGKVWLQVLGHYVSSADADVALWSDSNFVVAFVGKSTQPGPGAI